MPKLGCCCGHSISLHAIPCPNEGTLVWDADMLEAINDAQETILAYFEACRSSNREAWLAAAGWPKPGEVDDSLVVQYLLVKLFRRGCSVVRCPECRRIYIERQSKTNEFECFVPETQTDSTADPADTCPPQSPPSANPPAADE